MLTDKFLQPPSYFAMKKHCRKTWNSSHSLYFCMVFLIKGQIPKSAGSVRPLVGGAGMENLHTQGGKRWVRGTGCDTVTVGRGQDLMTLTCLRARCSHRNRSTILSRAWPPLLSDLGKEGFFTELLIVTLGDLLSLFTLGISWLSVHLWF